MLRVGACLGNKIKIMKKLAQKHEINDRKKGDGIIPNVNYGNIHE